MKTNFLKSLFTIACLLCSIAVYAHEFEVDGIYYNITAENEVEVTYAGDSYSAVYNEYTGAVAIPETITYSGITYNVTSIRACAFYRCTGLTSVVIPNSVTSIGNSAFNKCTGLTEVIIPNSVTSIGSNAFSGCTGLTAITIPEGVTSIGESAFYECSGLTTVNFNAENCTTMGSESFLVFVLCNNLTTVNIGESVKKIPDYGFRNCSGLTEITIPNSVTSIGDYAFWGCTGLTEVTIGNSVTSIGREAFAECTQLTSVNMGSSVTLIESGVFHHCTSLAEIAIPSSVTSIGYEAFRGCCALTSVTIPSSVTKIDNGAFFACTGLTSVTIPNSVTEIGYEAFHQTPFYNNQPDGVIYLGRVLYNYKGTMPMNTSLFVKEGTVSISYSAFNNCTDLTSITIPNSVTKIGDLAFYNCTGLTSIAIGNSVKEIGRNAFARCTGLTEIGVEATTPPTVYENTFDSVKKSIPVYVPTGREEAYRSADYWSEFTNIKVAPTIDVGTTVLVVNGIYYDVKSQKEVAVRYPTYSEDDVEYAGTIRIPEKFILFGIAFSVTSIGSEAFYGCTGLTEVTIPNSVTSIGSSAFSGCTGLTEVTIPNSVTSIGGNAFYNTPFYDNQPNGEVYFGSILYSYKGTMPDNTTINVKEGTTYISDYAFRSCTGLTEVTLPNSVTSIGREAFRGCTGLTEVTLPNSVTSTGWRVFCDCTGLTSVTIPNSVTEIGSFAFEECTGLTEVTIPNSVTSIGYDAFDGCTGLTEICVEATTPPTIYSSTFYQVDKSIPVYVPAGCEEAYRSADYWSEFTNIQAIKEPDVIATSLTLDNDVLEMYIGDAVQLTATVLPDNTTNKVVTWTSSDNEVATVDENGNVTAVSIGTATITATTTDGSDLSASCIVTVLPILATAIELDQEAVSIIAEKSATLTATVLPGNTTNKAVVWSTSDENIATVEDGVVTAISVGTATITATTTDGSNLSASCVVTVLPILATAIELDQEAVSIIAEKSMTLTATVLPGNTTNKAVVWSTSDENIATVEDGVVTAVSVGTATITATTTDGSNLSATCEVTVLPILATAIELDQDVVTVETTDYIILTATVLPDNTTNKAVVWSTSDENIATVEDGVVTAISVGTATITATTTDGSNLSATCEVTVEQKMVKLIMQNSYYNTVELFLLPGTEQKMRILAADVYYVLNSVVLNGENVTDEVVDGMYTTPALMEDAVLNISFDIPTAEDTPSVNSRIKAYGYRGDVVVTGCERGESIAIYDVDGVLLRTMYATGNVMRIAMPTDAIYVVKAADAAVKVAL